MPDFFCYFGAGFNKVDGVAIEVDAKGGPLSTYSGSFRSCTGSVRDYGSGD
jgi:hypothetical protein